MLTNNGIIAPPGLIATRVFQLADQQLFADFSGDLNPIHLDALSARRMQTGGVVVHGAHQVLWALEQLPNLLPSNVRIGRLRGRFPQFLFLDEPANLLLLQQDSSNTLQLTIRANEVIRANIFVELEHGKVDADPTAANGRDDIQGPTVCQHLSFHEMEGLSGDLPVWLHLRDAQLLFPAAAGLLGATRVSAIAALSRLIGMVCPGMNSIFSAINLRMVEVGEENRLQFSVVKTDRRFSFVRQKVQGGGIEGEVDGFMRTQPVIQPNAAEIAELVDVDEFADSVALVVGASRGLGEFVAKAIGAGGGRVIATYCVGRDDCEQVAAQIGSVGGRCDLIAYDARRSPAEQLEKLPVLPASLYYFATPKIFGRQSELFDLQRFNEFVEVYVTGFYALCSHLRKLGVPRLAVFYPSSVAIDSRPDGMTAYAMAKAAGEVLCDTIAESWPELCIVNHRLPRILTDQTNTLVSAESMPIRDIMLPIIREVERSVVSETEV